jgi:hypothetical protein
MGQFYSKNGASRNACLVFFNASQIAEQYNLHEIATLANQLLNRKAYMFNLSGQQQEEPLKDLFERFLASYIPQWPDIE